MTRAPANATITMRISKTHPLTDDPRDPRNHVPLCCSGRNFLEMLGGVRHSYVALAYFRGEIVGFFRFSGAAGRTLYAGGTWVRPAFRKRGIGYRLWALAIKRRAPRRICVDTIGSPGDGLVRSVKRAFKDVTFEWEPANPTPEDRQEEQ